MKLFIATYILMLLVIFILPFLSVESYSIVANTTSHLGAQKSPAAWVMNVTFVLLGIATARAAWLYFRHYMFQKIILTVFGLSLVMTAVFRHAPIEKNLAYDVKEDYWHALFSDVTGFAFTVFAFSLIFILKDQRQRWFALGMAVASTGISVLMFTEPHIMGLLQRLIFISAFGWLIYLFRKRRDVLSVDLN